MRTKESVETARVLRCITGDGHVRALRVAAMVAPPASPLPEVFVGAAAQ